MNLPFVLWMVGMPIASSIDTYVNEFLLKKTYSNNVEVVSAIIGLVVWVWIGKLLYKPATHL